MIDEHEHQDDETPEKPEANGYDDFCERFSALMEEACGYGLDTLIVLREHDPLSFSRGGGTAFERSRGTETIRVAFSSGLALALGMAAFAMNSLKSDQIDLMCVADDE